MKESGTESKTNQLRNVYLENTGGMFKVKKQLLEQKFLTPLDLQEKEWPAKGVVDLTDRPGRASDKTDEMVFFQGQKQDFVEPLSPKKERLFKFAPEQVLQKDSPVKRKKKASTTDQTASVSPTITGKQRSSSRTKYLENTATSWHDPARNTQTNIEGVVRKEPKKIPDTHPFMKEDKFCEQQKGKIKKVQNQIMDLAPIDPCFAEIDHNDKQSLATFHVNVSSEALLGNQPDSWGLLQKMNQVSKYSEPEEAQQISMTRASPLTVDIAKGIIDLRLGMAATMEVAATGDETEEEEDPLGTISSKSSEETPKKQLSDEDVDDDISFTQKYDFLALSRIKRSKEMLEAMSFVVPLEKLYEITKTCMANVRNPYVPVELKIVDKRLLSQFAGAYLIQVWDNKKELAFEYSSKTPVEVWSIIQNNFIFQLSFQEDDLHEEVAEVFGRKSEQVAVKTEADEEAARIYIGSYFLVRFETYGTFNQHKMRMLRVTQGSNQEQVRHTCVMVWENKLILANREYLWWIDLNTASIGIGIDDTQKAPDGGDLLTNNIKLEDFNKVMMHEKCKILGFQELTNKGEVAVVCEVPFGGQLVFVKINSLGDRLEFESLTANIRTGQDKEDEIKSWKSLVFYSQKFMEFRQVGIVLRTSGNLDFYSRYKIVETVKKTSGRREFVHVDLDFDNLHFKIWDSQLQQLSTFTCRTQWDQRIGFNTSTKIETMDQAELHKFKTSLQSLKQKLAKALSINGLSKFSVQKKVTKGEQKVSYLQTAQEFARTKVDMFGNKSFIFGSSIADHDLDKFSKSEIEALIKKMKAGVAGYQTMITQNFKFFNSFINAGRKLLMAHNCFVSVFNFVKNEWTSHWKFSDQVQQIFRNRLPLAKINEPSFNVGVLVGRSQFHFLTFEKLGRIKLDRKILRVPGNIETFCVDQVNDSAFYLITTNPKEEGLKRKASNLVDKKSNSIRIQSRKDLSTDGQQICLYALVNRTFSEITPKEFKLTKIPLSMCLEVQYSTDLMCQTLVMDTSNSPFEGWGIYLDVIRSKLVTKQSELSLKLSLNACDIKLRNENHIFLNTPVTINMWSETPWEKVMEKQRLLGKISLRNGKSVRISNKHIEIVDEKNAVETKFEDRNIRSFILVEEKFLYALTNTRTEYDPEEKKPAGEIHDPSILVWDFDSMTGDEPSLNSNTLGLSVGGSNDFLDYDSTTQTLAYIKDYTQLVIIPLLHRNTLKFYGMGPKSDYLLWRNTKGLFIALDKKLKVTMWSTVTGKIVTSKFIKPWPNPRDILDVIRKDDPFESSKKNSSQVNDTTDLFGSIKLVQMKPQLSIIGNNELSESIKSSYLQNFEVYKACSDDVTYTRSFYGFEDCSVSLLVCNDPIESNFVSTQTNTDLDFQIFSKNQDRHISVNSYQRAQETRKKYQFKVLSMGEMPAKPNMQSFQKSSIKINLSDDKEPKVFFWTEVFKFLLEIQVSKNSRPVLYLARNLTRLLRKDQTDSDAIIYDHDGVEDGSVTWIPKIKIPRYPVLLQGDTFANFLFSPNFDKFIDISFQDNQFIIVDTEREECVNRIPPGMLSISFKGRNKSKAAIRALASRMMFHSDTEIRVISKEGLDCILDISVPNFVKIKSFVKIDNFSMNDFSHPHALLEKSTLHPHEVMNRLIHKNMSFKQTLCHLQQKLERQKMPEKLIRKKLNLHLYKMIFSVDFTQKDSFAVELSFTMLDWIILERIVDDRTYDFTSVSRGEQIQLCFNIFPRIKTVFHILAVNPHVCDFKVIQGIFSLAKSHKDSRDNVTLPILPDECGDTPIDLCLSEGKQKNIKLASLLFQSTKDYPFLHSSIFLQKAVIRAIRVNVPFIGEYLDSRFQESRHLSTESMSNNAFQKKPNCINGFSYVLTQQEVWSDKKTVAESLFDPTGYPRALRLLYFDIPNISDESQVSDEFFEALGDSENLSLFSYLSVQIIINDAWDKQRVFFLCYFFLPYLLLLGCFALWTNTIQVEFDHQTLYSTVEAHQRAGLAFKVGVIAMCSFIIMQEVWQMIKQPKDYFRDFWNYVDLTPCICSLVPIVYDFLNPLSNVAEKPQWVRVFQAMASIFLWLKVLYFMRSFKKAGYLIKLIIEVILDMSIFLLILFIAQLAFADAFFTFSNMQPADARFADSYFDAIIMSYNFSLGNIYTDDMQSKAAIITMVASTLFNMVVMLNLLIAIISATYERVMDRYEEFAMKERTTLICNLRESNFLMKRPKEEANSIYTFVAITREQEESQLGDASLRDLMAEVKELKNEVKEFRQTSEKQE